MIEIWKDAIDCEGFYQVSNCGRIKSLHKSIPKILKQTLGIDGYYKVHLRVNGKSIYQPVHTLVFYTFSDEVKESGFVIDHIDNVKSNNHYTNLQKITQRLNCTKDKSGYKSEYLGVYPTKHNTWRSMYRTKDKKHHYIGCFETEEKAYEARIEFIKNLEQI